jgi:hypothetical protein
MDAPHKLDGFILRCLADQYDGYVLSSEEHQCLIALVDRKLLGMDGFKYCWPDTARENRRRFLFSNNPTNLERGQRVMNEQLQVNFCSKHPVAVYFDSCQCPACKLLLELDISEQDG